MSQKDAKRPASKDINDLKARLGLKKNAGAAGAAPSGPKTGSAVVPPPGLNLPPPPGVRPSQQQPAIPNASDDPFGAMNAMAQMGTAQRAPEIVIVNDGKPVESVSTGERAAKIGKIAGLALAPLVVGLVIGQISKENNIYNAGLSDAKAVTGDVGRVRKVLGEIGAQFEAAGSDRKAAEEMTAVLEQNKDKLASTKETVFRVKMNTLNADLAAATLSFYAAAQEVQDLIQDHLGLAKYEASAMAVSAEQVAAYATKDGLLKDNGIPYKLGLILKNPEEPKPGEEQGAQLVEIGAILCGPNPQAAKEEASGKCPNGDVAGFQYRFNQGAAWYKGKLHTPGSLDGGEKFPNDELIIVTPNGTLSTLVKTAPGSYAEQAYNARLNVIREKAEAARKKGEDLEAQLKKKSATGTRFTFFL